VNAFGEVIKVMFTAANLADNNIHQMMKLFDKKDGLLLIKDLLMDRQQNNYCKKDYIF